MGRSSSNLQNFYLTLSNNIKQLHNHLVSPPMLSYIFKNKQGLLYNADIIQFKKNSWNQNPMLFCHEQYDSQHYYPIILICNNLGSIYEFNSSNLSNGIISPLIDTIEDIISTAPLTDIRS